MEENEFANRARSNMIRKYPLLAGLIRGIPLPDVESTKQARAILLNELRRMGPIEVETKHGTETVRVL